MQPGEFHLIDAQRPFHGIDAAARLGAAIPYAAIGYEPTRHAARFSLRADTPAGHLLSAGLGTLFAQASRASADDGAALAAGFVALLRGVLFPATADDAARSAVERIRAAAIRRYVDAHFTDPTISAEAVGGVVGASRATVYRVFMPEGGFERAVLDRRLRAAANELSQTPARRGRHCRRPLGILRRRLVHPPLPRAVRLSTERHPRSRRTGGPGARARSLTVPCRGGGSASSRALRVTAGSEKSNSSLRKWPISLLIPVE
ncbi:MAG TPA: hypothetical protein VLE23_00345 [Geminicoccaceae bacterium]|nr:hypothetical protein [Geminicoccaceae bacterium]